MGVWLAGSEKLRIRLKLSTAGAWALLSLAINNNMDENADVSVCGNSMMVYVWSESYS